MYIETIKNALVAPRTTNALHLATGQAIGYIPTKAFSEDGEYSLSLSKTFQFYYKLSGCVAQVVRARLL